MSVKGHFNVSWRRPQRKREMPLAGSDNALPPMPPAGLDDDHTPAQIPAGDGLGESTAPVPGKARGTQKEPETA